MGWGTFYTPTDSFEEKTAFIKGVLRELEHL